MYDFSVKYNTINKSDTLTMHEYLMVKNNIKCCGLLNKCLLHNWVLTDLSQLNVSLNNKPCMARPTLPRTTLILLNLITYSWLDKCSSSWNVVDDFSMTICVPKETKDINVQVFNMVTRKQW